MVVVDKITKCFGDVKAVDRVSFEVPDGGSLAILGPSGSGKTTLLRLVAGLEVPNEGAIHINGTLVSKAQWALAPRYRDLGFVFQRPALWPHMTVAQNILFGLNGIPRKDALNRVSELLEKVSLSGFEHRYPHQISVGEARRIAIVRTLAPKPRYLLMDEPLVNLDLYLKNAIAAAIQNLVSTSNTSLIYVTHDPDEIVQKADRVIRLTAGRLESNFADSINPDSANYG
jgi:iron(III) transport system ATP-binding protein